MKQKLLLLLLSICSISFAKPVEKPAANPAIGLIMIGQFQGNGFLSFEFRIKNYGEETLTNIYVSNLLGNPYNIEIYSNPSTVTVIPSLAPGQEDIVTFTGFKNAYCFDQSQAMVTATTSTGAEITDLSDNYSYYENNLTYSYYQEMSIGYQDGTYQDLNGNNIIDVGDVVNYSYLVFNEGGQITIFDDNAIVANPFGFGTLQTYGVHYLTQADIDLGYVYNSSYYTSETSCFGSAYFYDQSSCSGCPNPNGVNVVTKLTSLLPNTISGNVKFNANNDNCATGINYPNRRITTTNGPYSYSTYTNNSGNYSILIPNTGTYATSANENLNANLTSNPGSISVISSGDNVDFGNNNFCISSATNYADLKVCLIAINQSRPGFTSYYRIYYRNNGSTNLSGSLVLTYENGKMTFNSATPATVSSTANTLTWNYSNLLPFQFGYVDLNFTVAPPPTVNTGDALAFTLVGNPIAGDSIPADNTFALSQPVFSSFDPNDKTVLEGASITLPQASRDLHYITRFQNTGTANATTVVLKETLDAKLDWNTFEPIASSHPNYSIQIQNGNQLTITYSDIDLAYSSANEPASHGYFVYKIKPKNTVVVGDSFSSTARIYFDYNPYIQTNTVTTTINALSNEDFTRNSFVVYPNPANDFITIDSNLNLTVDYQISDLNGKILSSGKTETGNQIDINKLQSGFYMLTISSESQRQTFKIIKQ